MSFDYNKLPKLEQKIILTVLILFSLFLIFSAFNQFISAWNIYRNAGLADLNRTVVFSGEGRVSVKPDTAKVNIGLITEGKNTIAVQNENSSKMNAVIKFLKDNGVGESDIKTGDYLLSPKYEYTKGKSSLVGYALNQNLEVMVRNLDKVGAILDGAVRNGANQINSISLFVDKPEELKNKAREEAVKQAKEKAFKTSKVAGFVLGRLIGFNENTFGQPAVFQSAGGKGGGLVASPDIKPGSQEVVVNVSLTYLIR